MSFTHSVTFRDWRKDIAPNDVICPLCGGSVSSKRLTKDHVVPVSLCKEDKKGIGVQRLCFRCNSLKANLPPTAWVYKLVQGVRVLESEVDGFHANSIRLNNTHQSIYKVAFEHKVGFYSMESSSTILLYQPRNGAGFWSSQKVKLVQRLLSPILLDDCTQLELYIQSDA